MAANRQRLQRHKAGLRKAFNRWEELGTLATADVASEVAIRAAQKSPRETGRLAANFGVGSGPGDVATLPPGNYDLPSKEDYQADAELLAQNGYVWIGNPLPYAPVAEFGLYPDGPKTAGGYSLQAPEGMLASAVVEVVSDLRSRKVIAPASGWNTMF